MIRIFFSFLVCFSSLFSIELAGVKIPDASSELALNGVGIRDKFFMDLYVGALYLKNKQSDAQQILQSDEKMSIKLYILSSLITSEKMEDATREGFEKSLHEDIASMQPLIEEFISVFKEEIKIGDVYDLVYTPEIGVDIYKNTTYKKTIKTLAFKKALFGIWLGEDPIQDSLKESMLKIER
jgi:hypothetical protein